MAMKYRVHPFIGTPLSVARLAESWIAVQPLAMTPAGQPVHVQLTVSPPDTEGRVIAMMIVAVIAQE